MKIAKRKARLAKLGVTAVMKKSAKESKVTQKVTPGHRDGDFDKMVAAYKIK